MPQLLGQNVQERAIVVMISKILMDFKIAITMPTYTGELN
jgi:hypothetical protein